MPAVVYTEASAKPDYSAPPSSSSPYIYLSTQLGCPLDLAGSLSLGGTLPWVVTSPRYHQLFPQLLPAWGHLLQKLGARRLLALQHHDVAIINRPGISCSPWLPLRPQLLRLQDTAEPLQAAKLSKAQAKALKGDLQHRWEVADCRCPDLERLVSGLVSEDEVTKAERLLAHLGAEWGHYKQAFEASARWGPGGSGHCWVCTAVGPLLECVSACPCYLASCSCLHALYPQAPAPHTDMLSPCHVHAVASTFHHPHLSPTSLPPLPSCLPPPPPLTCSPSAPVTPQVHQHALHHHGLHQPAQQHLPQAARHPLAALSPGRAHAARGPAGACALPAGDAGAGGALPGTARHAPGLAAAAGRGGAAQLSGGGQGEARACGACGRRDVWGLLKQGSVLFSCRGPSGSTAAVPALLVHTILSARPVRCTPGSSESMCTVTWSATA